MTEFDRFVEFLRREGAGYNAPPETPIDAMWASIETGLESEAATPDEEISIEDLSLDPLDTVEYNEPPEAPREVMWGRIESAWAMRRAAPSPAGGDARWDLEDVRERRDRRALMVMAGLAVAASMVVGVFLGRGVLAPATDAQLAFGPADPPSPGLEAAGEAVGSGSSDVTDSDELLAVVDPDVSDQPLETSEVFVASADDAPRNALPASSGQPGAESRPTRTLAEDRIQRRAVAARYATAEHLGRAATMLTAFRNDDASPTAQAELAGWARGLLGETRLLLDMDVERTLRETALLEDLELVLAQIARLGPDAPDFERDLIREGMEHRGTLMQLRSQTPLAGT